jgi:uncharacterized protein (DUF1501 family)
MDDLKGYGPNELSHAWHSQPLSRRDFLKQAGVFSLSLLGLGLSGWFNRVPAATTGNTNHRLVVIMLRGAVDGLSIVPPYSEQDYYAVRPNIAVPPPGQAGGAINLDGRFGLHPGLQSLMPFWQQGSLGFVQASGSPDPSRSHFDAQEFMENGTPGSKRISDGWMNRLMGILPNQHSPTQAVSFSSVIPNIFKGPQSVANMDIARATGKTGPLDRPKISSAFDQLYTGNDAISVAYREGMAARHTLLEDLSQEMVMAKNGAPSVQGFSKSAKKLAQVLVNDPSIQLVFTDLGGWDTHFNQGTVQGPLAGKLQSLGDGLAVLLNGLGSTYANTTVIVMSEFGRTVKENGDSGTDHGHGNVMWVAGGKVKGGKVYGEWPGINPEALFEGRDLQVTTDFRSVIASELAHGFGLNQGQIQKVFPNFQPSYGPIANLFRG